MAKKKMRKFKSQRGFVLFRSRWNNAVKLRGKLKKQGWVLVVHKDRTGSVRRQPSKAVPERRPDEQLFYVRFSYGKRVVAQKVLATSAHEAEREARRMWRDIVDWKDAEVSTDRPTAQDFYVKRRGEPHNERF